MTTSVNNYDQVRSAFHEPCRLCDNTGQPLTGAVPLSIDSVTAVSGDRILEIGSSGHTTDGIYLYTDDGTNYTMVYDLDFADNSKVYSGLTTYISEGTQYAGFTAVLTTPNPIVVGTTALTWALNEPNNLAQFKDDSNSNPLVANVWTLTNTPVDEAHFLCFQNGLLLNADTDYSLSGNSLTLNVSIGDSDVFIADYWYVG